MKRVLNLKEACGIIGVYDERGNIGEKIFYGLMALQHRGQESAGIALTTGDGNIYLRKGMGLVAEALSLTELSMLKSRFGVGHVRYSTVGRSSLTDAQPFNLNSTALAYNGTIVNYVELKEKLRKSGVYFTSTSDAELLLNILLREFKENGDFFDSLSELSKYVEGAYSAVCLTGDEKILVFRDPLGFRPLCFGEVEGGFIGASESVAIDMVGGKLISDVKPGEAILISDSGVERECFMKVNKRAYCMFEFVYFSRPDSVIEGRSVYDVRLRLGVNLAKTYDRNDADVIVPVPDTSRPAAEGMARFTGLPVAEGLIKNRYIYRTFIMPKQDLREGAVRVKLNPLRSVLKDKKIILIDDSIVRGTTIRSIIQMIRRAGAKEVHVRVTCPPIVSPCFYGIDIATHRELIASKRCVEEICRIIGADSLGYQTIENLIDAIGIKKENLCLACLTGEYPTPKAQKLADTMKRKAQYTEGRYVESNL